MPLSVLIWFGARRYPALFTVAAVNFAVHSIVPHKEYRFIVLTTFALVLLGAIGSVDAWRRYVGETVRIPIVIAGWILAGAACAALGSSAREWGQNHRMIEAWRIAAREPGVCGVGVYRPEDALIVSYALFGGNAPIYQFEGNDAPRGRSSRAFNMLVTPGRHASAFPGYALRGCGDPKKPDLCVFVRPGTCSPTAEDQRFRINAVLERNNL